MSKLSNFKAFLFSEESRLAFERDRGFEQAALVKSWWTRCLWKWHTAEMHRAVVCMDGCCHTVVMAVLDEKGTHFTNGREETASFHDDDRALNWSGATV